MPAETVISRVNTIDFFAVLVPGFYLTCVLCLSGFLFLDDQQLRDSPWRLINDVLADVTVGGAVVAILASYLLGSLVRAVPVLTADKFGAWICLKPPLRYCIRPRRLVIYRYTFPYPRDIRRQFRRLGGADEFDLHVSFNAKEEHFHQRFNFWKAVICRESSELFGTARSCEARVRMFAGIIWAACAATAVALVQAIALDAKTHGWKWSLPSLLVSAVSLLIFLCFLLRLRGVRLEEARTVFFAYLTLCRK